MRIPHRSMAACAALVALAAATGCPSSGGRCESSALCDDGTFCFEGECVAQLPGGACTPSVLPVITYAGVAPSGYTPTCPAPPPAAAAIGTLPAGWVQDFPAVPTGQSVAFQVPAGTASVTIHFQGTTPAPTDVVDFNNPSYGLDYNYVIPAEVTLPNGEALFEYLDAFSGALDPVLASGFFAPNPWAATLTVPVSHRLADLALSQGRLPPGTWRVKVADYQSECALFGGCLPQPTGSYRLTVITKPGPYVASGKLDVAIHFASGTVGAGTAAGSAVYERFVNGIDLLLGRAGICVNEVRFIEIPDAIASGFYTTDISFDPAALPPCDQLSRLFALGRPDSPTDPGLDAVHLFLVDNLLSGGDGVVGLTGSIPGPTGLPGAISAGIVMSVQDITDIRRSPNGAPNGTCADPDPFSLLCDADFAAYVAAHEIGHWLGLLHPTAMDGDMLDPLADTASCACADCASFCPPPAGIPTSSCLADAGPCGGGWNLMFWQVDPNRSRGDLTREQGFVMRANPAVKWSTP